jgi:protease-4
MNQLLKFLGGLVLALIIGIILMSVGAGIATVAKDRVTEPEGDVLLVLELEGVILDGKRFLEQLIEYREKENVKGILLRINSPGGVVGPSQEIYREIVRTRAEFKKPVYAFGRSLVASGAYYAAVGADKIYSNPGTLIGSIGAIMEFANLEKLYEWAKIERFTVQSGKFKDIGSEHRPMRDEEREMLTAMTLEILQQFKGAIAEGRKMAMRDVDEIADGRIMTGVAAQRLGLIDQIATFSEVVKIAGEELDLGEKPELFEPPKKKRSFFELASELEGESRIEKAINGLLGRKLLGKPLYLMPGAFIE